MREGDEGRQIMERGKETEGVNGERNGKTAQKKREI